MASHQHAHSDHHAPLSGPEWLPVALAVLLGTPAIGESVATLSGADDQIHRSHNLELLEAILAIAFLTGGLTATLRSDSAQMILLGVSVAVLSLAAIGLVILW